MIRSASSRFPFHRSIHRSHSSVRVAVDIHLLLRVKGDQPVPAYRSSSQLSDSSLPIGTIMRRELRLTSSLELRRRKRSPAISGDALAAWRLGSWLVPSARPLWV